MAVIVPVHAGLLGEAHGRMLVGLFAWLVLKVVCPQRVSERQSGTTLSCLRARDYLNLFRQGVEALPLLGATAYFLVLLAHDLVLIATSPDWGNFFGEGRLGMAGKVAEQDIVVLLNLVLKSNNVLA